MLPSVKGLEKAMAAHSRVLAWRIPGTGEPGGLPSMGSHRVGHDWATWQQQCQRLDDHFLPTLNLSLSTLSQHAHSWNPATMLQEAQTSSCRKITWRGPLEQGMRSSAYSQPKLPAMWVNELSEDPRYHSAEKNHLLCALFEFITLKIRA